MAYIQCDLGGDQTWVELPKDLQPEEWSKYRDPVCILKKSLYGHPDSGGYWEQHCESRLLEADFVPIDSWRSCFWNDRLKLYLTVYVDDFKMVCKTSDAAKLWQPLQKLIRLSEPKPADRYLGCYTQRFEAKLSEFKPLLSTLPSQWSRKDATGEKRTTAEPWKPTNPHKTVVGNVYDMSQYLRSNVVDKYCLIAGTEVKP